MERIWWLPSLRSGKEPACLCRRHKRCGFDPWVGKIPWRKKWHATPIFLPGKSHGQRSLADYTPWGSKESHRTEHLNSNNNMYLYLSSLKRKDINKQDPSYSSREFYNITSLKPPRQSHEETGDLPRSGS